MKTVFQRASEFATGRNVLIFVLLHILLIAVFMTVFLPATQEYTNGSMLMFSFDAREAYTAMNDLTEDGRNAYIALGLFDIIIPLMYSIEFCLIIVYFLKKISLRTRLTELLVIVPFLLGLVNILENVSIISLLLIFPEVPGVLLILASVFSLLKLVFFLSTSVLILGSIVLWMIHSLRALALARK